MNSKSSKQHKTTDPAANPDPITHTPGAHPLGAGAGAAAGGALGAGAAAAIGAAAGTAVGPVGTIVGAVVGGVAGGLVGKDAAELVNPTVEREYWRKTYTTRPYVPVGILYEEVSPAYQIGWEARSRYRDQSFDQVEASLSDDWERNKGNSKLDWARARQAARDAWEHADSSRAPRQQE